MFDPLLDVLNFRIEIFVLHLVIDPGHAGQPAGPIVLEQAIDIVLRVFEISRTETSRAELVGEQRTRIALAIRKGHERTPVLRYPGDIEFVARASAIFCDFARTHQVMVHQVVGAVYSADDVTAAIRDEANRFRRAAHKDVGIFRSPRRP